MSEGRKSRTAIALACLLAMLAACVAIPAHAGAQAAVDEYELGDLPDPDGDDGKKEGGGGAPPPSSGSGAPPTAGAPGAEPVGSGSGGEAKGGDGSSKGGNQGGGNGGGAKASGSSGTGASSVPVAGSDPSDDGGVPVLLILLALLAAGCTGVAIWRLRKHEDEAGPVGPAGTQKTTAETQSL